MKTLFSVAVVWLLTIGTQGLVVGEELSAGWTPVAGQWALAREIVPVVHQKNETGTALILAPSSAEPVRVFRAVVKPSVGTGEAGLWLDADRQASGGLQVLLGRSSNVGGFSVRAANGDTLWEDRFAPWNDYSPYVLEGIATADKLRVQMFDGTGNVLVSQSPWLDLDEGNRPFLLTWCNGGEEEKQPKRSDHG